MLSFPHVARAMQRVLTEVPTALARTTGFCQRRSKLTAACFVEMLVLGWLAHPSATLHQLSQRARDRGVSITPQGIAKRFTSEAAELLKAVWEASLTEVIASEPVAIEVLTRFPAVVLLDSTTISLPDELRDVWVGCGGRVPQGGQSALKLSVRLDLCTGSLAAAPSDGRSQDKSSPLQIAPLPTGALRIADLGYWTLEVLQATADQGAYVLSRLSLQTVVFGEDGERIDLERWLTQERRDRCDVAVTLGLTARVPVRLLVMRVPPLVAEERRAAIRADAKREGQPPNARKLALAGWTLLVTNAPDTLIGFEEAEVLARARWQIELLFKCWKSGGQIDEWRSADPDRILCEVYAKLTAMIIQHWILLTGSWHLPDRSVIKGAHLVRDYAVSLILAFSNRRALIAILNTIGRGLATGCRIDPRHRNPNTYQLLTDPISRGLG